jgi:hypothetical protein
MEGKKQARWICPTCGNGRLAPTRPRRDDVRRYCLPCSEESGRLVERIAPALERQREKKSTKKKAARKRKRATRTRREAPKKELAKVKKNLQRRDTNGMPYKREAERIWKILEPYHKGRPLPRIVVPTRGVNIENGKAWMPASGVAGLSYGGKIVVKPWAGWGTLAHELAHEVDYGKRSSGRRPHDEVFYAIVRHIYEKRWRVQISNYGITRWGYNVDRHYELQVRHLWATAWQKSKSGDA